MNRPAHLWMMAGGSLAVLLAATGWVSLTVLRLDRAQAEARQQAEMEEKVRSALWRMDSFLTPLVVEESARPYSQFSAFHAPERAYSKGYAALPGVLIPSPLLTYASSNLLLHFQLDATGGATSPQVPLGAERALALSTGATEERINAAASRLSSFQAILNAKAVLRPRGPAALSGPAQNPLSNGELLLTACAPARTNPPPLFTLNAPIAAGEQQQRILQLQEPLSQLNPSQVKSQEAEAQGFRNSAERNARANVYQQAAQNELGVGNYALPGGVRLQEGPVQPVWIDSALVLARRVTVEGRTLVQGAWLNWPVLRQSLLDTVRDLLPEAELEPVLDGHSQADARLLATLPARLVIAPAALSGPAGWTPMQLSLLVVWLCVLVATGAVALLLHATVSLSERRAAFVSAVTHELRTPLTTFKMYSEMLAEDMVPDADKRKAYLRTLCAESNRLGHLVENVLAYARLERGSSRRNVEVVTLGQLIQRVRERLVQRSAQAGLALVVDADGEALNRKVRVDVSVVEQILFNLVDNACKYAAPQSADKILHLEAIPGGQQAMLRVRDHGQGISPEAARHLFQPFNKSAQEAAHSAPGVGLGLALCRRLSRGLGGDLTLDRTIMGGACFVLSLPSGG